MAHLPPIVRPSGILVGGPGPGPNGQVCSLKLDDTLSKTTAFKDAVAIVIAKEHALNSFTLYWLLYINTWAERKLQ